MGHHHSDSEWEFNLVNLVLLLGQDPLEGIIFPRFHGPLTLRQCLWGRARGRIFTYYFSFFFFLWWWEDQHLWSPCEGSRSDKVHPIGNKLHFPTLWRQHYIKQWTIGDKNQVALGVAPPMGSVPVYLASSLLDLSPWVFWDSGTGKRRSQGTEIGGVFSPSGHCASDDDSHTSSLALRWGWLWAPPKRELR